MTFRELLEGGKVIEESNITRANWEGLKKFFKAQPGYVSWEFEDDYHTLVIGFKSGSQASNAVKKSNTSGIEVNAFGEVTVQGPKVTVELNKDAIGSLEK